MKKKLIIGSAVLFAVVLAPVALAGQGHHQRGDAPRLTELAYRLHDASRELVDAAEWSTRGRSPAKRRAIRSLRVLEAETLDFVRVVERNGIRRFHRVERELNDLCFAFEQAQRRVGALHRPVVHRKFDRVDRLVHRVANRVERIDRAGFDRRDRWDRWDRRGRYANRTRGDVAIGNGRVGVRVRF